MGWGKLGGGLLLLRPPPTPKPTFLVFPKLGNLNCSVLERFLGAGGGVHCPAEEKIASHSFPKDFSRTVGKGTERICELAKDIFECLQTSKDQPKVLFQRIKYQPYFSPFLIKEDIGGKSFLTFL